MVPVLDTHRNRSTKRFTPANTSQKLDAVRLDLHSAPTPITTLASLEVPIDVGSDERYPGWDPFHHRYNRRPVRLAPRHPPQSRHAFTLAPRRACRYNTRSALL
jgi:hypothetical protein